MADYKEENTSFQTKGIKISTINIIAIAISFLICAFLAASILSIRSNTAAMRAAYENCIDYRDNGRMTQEGSYYLSEQVHMFVETENKIFADNYFNELNVTRRRKTAIYNLRTNEKSYVGYDSLIAAVESSDELSQREIYAIRLIAEAKNDDISLYDSRVADCELNKDDALLPPDGKRALAKELVYGEGYLAYRTDIDNKIQQFMDETYDLSVKTADENRLIIVSNLVKQCVLAALMLALNIAIFLIIHFLILKPLKIYMKCIRENCAFEVRGAYEFKDFARVYNDIFKTNREYEKMLRHKADHDAMTGLLNKGAFEHISEKFVGCDMPIALLIIDIDDFKSINDTYGHDTGDDIIKSVSELLTRSFRRSDVIVRFGGDEFAIIMSDVTTASAGNIKIKIDNLNKILKNPKNGLPGASLSIGAAFSEKGYSEDLFKNADNALYYTKQHGRCGCTFSDAVIRA